jgi:large subunit ribosomal protein L22
MSDATATLKHYRQAPRKVRLVADLVRGKKVDHALALLSTLPKRAAEPMAKLIRSAVANAKVPTNELVISKIEVGQGVVFKRFMPRARGRASAIRKKASHITLALTKKSAPKN